MDVRYRHAGLPHTARSDRTVTRVARAKYAGKARFEGKRLPPLASRSRVDGSRDVFTVAPIIGNRASASRLECGFFKMEIGKVACSLGAGFTAGKARHSDRADEEDYVRRRGVGFQP
jgi:hypothetical protein